MERDVLNQTIELRRKLARLKNRGLEGMSYVKSQIFIACETPDCGSYVCNLSTGKIEESHGLVTLLNYPNKPDSVEAIDALTHPADRKRIHEILATLCEFGLKKEITSTDRLSCTYRIRLGKKYIQIHRKSGLVKKENTGELLNWSNIYANPELTPLNYVRFKWTGKNISHLELTDRLSRKKTALFTRKELEILTILNEGKSSSHAADSLQISKGTLKKHLSNMFKKTRAKSRIQLLKYFERDQKE